MLYRFSVACSLIVSVGLLVSAATASETQKGESQPKLFEPRAGAPGGNPLHYVEKAPPVKRDVLICDEEGYRYVAQIKRFAETFFPGAYNIIDAHTSVTIENASYVYVGHFPLSEKSDACVKKHAPLAALFKARVSQKAIDEQIEENRKAIELSLQHLDHAPEWLKKAASGAGGRYQLILSPFAKLDEARTHTESLALLCHRPKRSCIEEVVQAIFWLKTGFCQQFDCDSVISRD